MAYIIGVDPGLTKVNPMGVAILSTSGRLVSAFSLTPNEKTDWTLRIPAMIDSLSTVVAKTIGSHSQIVGVGFEAPFTGLNVSSGMKLAYIGGAVLYQSNVWKARFIEFHPTSIKKAFTGSGRAEKSDMIAEVARRFKEDVNKDEADAVAVACLVFDTLLRGD